MTVPRPVQIAPRDKGARSRADISPDWLAALQLGQVASRTLVEILAIDQTQLLAAVLPQLCVALPGTVADALKTAGLLEQAAALNTQGIGARMRSMAALVLQHGGQPCITNCGTHPSDTVRGWACFMIAQQSQHDGWSLQQLLAQLEPLAADTHFGVREWAWMAARPALAQDVVAGVAALLPWARSVDANLRRFASEALRPRGVWCAHIAELKTTPHLALPLLELLKADNSEYVRLSVGNWLNDAAKTCPNWVQEICAQWQQENPCPETAYICRHALRSFKNKT